MGAVEFAVDRVAGDGVSHAPHAPGFSGSSCYDARSQRLVRRLAAREFWLLSWGVGGLLVMSCIPSKRVDRIFPIVPPLCLLVAGLMGRWRERFGAASNTSTRDRLACWCAGVLLAAMIFASGYTAFRIISGVCDHRDALATCGREFRLRAGENHCRYAVLKSSNEALVLYLDVPAFVPETEAVQRWNDGELDALIVSKRRMDSLLPGLQPGEPVKSDFCRKVKGQQQYTILEH